MKKIICVALAVLLVSASVICAGADEQTLSEPDFQFLNETLTIPDNQVYITSYNISKNYSWGVYLESEDESIKTATIPGIYCITNPQKLSVKPDVEYNLYSRGFFGGNGSTINYKFDATGGTYRKVRYKLSNISEFNADGSFTRYDFDYYFHEDQIVENGKRSGCIIVICGGVISFVAPDEDGYIEFYISDEIDVTVDLYKSFCEEIGSVIGGGGGTCMEIGDFTKGITSDDDKVRISHATSIQRYMAKQHKFVGLEEYRADVNCDSAIDILDATLIQRYLARK